MTIVKNILNDVSYVCELMENNEGDMRLLRLHFVLCVTLLRSVGHVLDKVVSTESLEQKTAIKKWWDNLKAHRDDNAIFFDFIEKERNLIVKEYEVNIHEHDVEVMYQTNGGTELFNLGDLYRPLSDTTYSDEDIRDIIANCIVWWNKQLEIIGEIIKNDKA